MHGASIYCRIEPFKAVLKCAEGNRTAQLLYEHKGIAWIYNKLPNNADWDNLEFLKLTVGALHNCIAIDQCIADLDKLNALSCVMELLEFAYDKSDRIIAYACGIISRLLCLAKNVLVFCSADHFEMVVYLLNFSHPFLLQMASFCLCKKIQRSGRHTTSLVIADKSMF